MSKDLKEKVLKWIEAFNKSLPAQSIQSDNYPFGVKTYQVYRKEYIDFQLEKLRRILEE